MALLFGIVLGLLTLQAISLRKAYGDIPAKELKRRARQGDPYATGLYRASAYGASLNVVLWGLVGLSAAGFFLIIVRELPGWLAFLGVVSVVWFGFAWMPSARLSGPGRKVALRTAPLFGWFMERLHPLVSRVADFLRRHRPVVHTGLYEKEDLLELIQNQLVQTYNRIDEDELRIAWHALSFGDRIIRDVMTPRRMMRTVAAEETIGPVLMGELHDSGFSRFPVTGDGPDDIIGTLLIKDLVGKKSGGLVKSVMTSAVYYVNEERPLVHVLEAFLKTKHHVFIVVNSFAEVVGLITIEDVLEQVIGRRIVDEFDKYDDLRAVAELQAAAEAAERVGENPDNLVE